MKKILFLFSIIVLLCFFCVGDAHAEGVIRGFSLKLTGGYGTFSGGDMNDFFMDLNLQVERTADILGLDLDGSFEEINGGPEFEAEFILQLPKNFFLGLGMGHIYRKKESTVEATYLNTLLQSILTNTKFTAIPITLNMYYNLSLATKWAVFLKAGIGYYFGRSRYEVREETRMPGFASYWDLDTGTASGKGFGFQGGIGLEYNLSKRVSLVLEGHGRHVDLDNWKGENKSSNSIGQGLTNSVEWFYLEELDDVTGNYYRSISISDISPGGPGIRNVRPANISFSGISIRLGIRLSFGDR